jgi:hypothetical protein
VHLVGFYLLLLLVWVVFRWKSDQNSPCFPTDVWSSIPPPPEKQLSLPIDRVASFKYETIFSLITRLLYGDILDKAYEGEELSHQGLPGCVPDRHLYKGGRTLQTWVPDGLVMIYSYFLLLRKLFIQELWGEEYFYLHSHEYESSVDVMNTHVPTLICALKWTVNSSTH